MSREASAQPEAAKIRGASGNRKKKAGGYARADPGRAPRSGFLASRSPRADQAPHHRAAQLVERRKKTGYETLPLSAPLVPEAEIRRSRGVVAVETSKAHDGRPTNGGGLPHLQGGGLASGMGREVSCATATFAGAGTIMTSRRAFSRKPFHQASNEPCIHCGSFYNQLSCHGSASTDGTPFNLAYHVSCWKCRSCGPAAQSAGEALKAWEHRAQPLQNEEPPVMLSGMEFEGGEEESDDRPDSKTLLPH